MKKLLVLGGCTVAAVVAAVAALPLLLDANAFRDKIQATLESNLERKVELGTLGVKLFPLSVRVDNVRIAEAGGVTTSEPFLTAKEILVHVDLMALLKKEIRVDSLTVTQPTARIIKTADGKWNYESLGRKGAGSGESRISFTLLSIEDASVVLIRPGAPNQTFDHAQLKLHDFIRDKPAQLEASLHLAGEGKELIELNGTLNKGFDGGFKLTEVSQSGVKGLSATGAIRALRNSPIEVTADVRATEPAVSAKLEATIKSGEAMEGTIRASNLELNRKDWKQPLRIAQLNVTLAGDDAKFQPFRIETGKLKASVSLAVQNLSNNPHIEASMESAGELSEVLEVAAALGLKLDFEASGAYNLKANLSGPAGKPEAIAYNANGTLDNGVIKLPNLAKPMELRHTTFKASPNTVEVDVDAPVLNLLPANAPASTAAAKPAPAATPSKLTVKGSVKIGKLITSSLTMDNVRSQFSMNHGIAKLDPMEAVLFGGKIGGSITADLGHQPAEVSIATNMIDVDAAQLLGATTGLRTLTGKLAAESALQFRAAPGEQLAKSLNGDLKIDMTDGRISGINLLNELSKIGKFLGYQLKQEGFTDFAKLSGSLKVRNGMAQTDNLRLDFGGGSLAASGTLHLAEELLAMKIVATLNKDTSAMAGGSQIGGFLATALSSSNGELVLPINASGTFSKPRFTPDAERMAKMKLESTAGGILKGIGIKDGTSGVQGLIDLFKKKKQ